MVPAATAADAFAGTDCGVTKSGESGEYSAAKDDPRAFAPMGVDATAGDDVDIETRWVSRIELMNGCDHHGTEK